MMKKCTKCNELLPLDQFNEKSTEKDTFDSRCKGCIKQYYLNHKEERKQYLLDHKEEIKQRKKQYYSNHKEEIKQYAKQYGKQYYSNHKDKIKQYTFNHKEQKKQYDLNHKEEIKQNSKRYELNHKEEIKQRKKQYNLDHKEKIAQQEKQYRLDHKEERKQNGKQYELNHKEERKQRKKQYYIDNKEKIKQRSKEYNFNHKEERKQYYIDNKEEKKQYYINNKQNINKRQQARRKNDPVYRLMRVVSCAVSLGLKKQGTSKNGASVWKYLPYTPEQLRLHLKNNYESWMTSDNYGKYDSKTWDDNDSLTWKWQIDHIIPQSDLPFSDMNEANFKTCWALENLRPLSAKQNLKDGANRTRHKKKVINI
jgi:hypothetical protein